MSDVERSPEWQAVVRSLIVRRFVLGYSQREAAERSGLYQSQISDIELLVRVPTCETLVRLATAYGTRVVLEEIPT